MGYSYNTGVSSKPPPSFLVHYRVLCYDKCKHTPCEEDNMSNEFPTIDLKLPKIKPGLAKLGILMLVIIIVLIMISIKNSDDF